MDGPSKPRRTRLHALRKLLTTIAILGLVLVSVGFVGVAIVWGHFWEFRVGDPSSSTCSNCHVLDSYVNSLSERAMLAGQHAAQGVGCVDCHDWRVEQQMADTVAYLTGEYTEPLPRLQVKMDQCFTCHEHSSYDQIAWRTTDLGVTDPTAKGHIANPHQPPHYTELECSSCHRMHQPSTLLCLECHTYEFPGLPIVAEATPQPGSP